MATRPWYEIEDILRSKGFGGDDLFAFKQNYFDNLIEDSGYDPEDEELKRKRQLFLYGNNKEWELLKSAKSGLIRGLAEVPETGADVIEFGQKFIPGESDFANKVEAGLRGEAQQVREAAGPFQPSSFQERLTSNLAAVPGAVASMAPIATPIAAATPALATVVPATAAAALTGAAGFGLYEAIRNARGTPEEMVKGGLKGAALGAITGAAGPLTREVGRGVKSAVLADLKGRAAAGALAGAGTGALELATGAEPEEAAQTAATFALLSATHRNLYNKVRKSLAKSGITDVKTADLTMDALKSIEAENLAKAKKDRVSRKKGGTEAIEAALNKRRPGTSGEWVVDVETKDGKFEVDASIAPLVQFLNDNGLTTIQSMSGLVEDYEGTPAKGRYSPDGYISFPKKSLTEKQIGIIRNAAEGSGLSVEDSDTFLEPSLVVRTGVSKSGESYRSVLKKASRETIRKLGISDKEYQEAYSGKDTENLRGRRESSAFPGTMTDPIPKAFDNYIGARDALLKQMWKDLGGNISNSEIRSRWNKFQSIINESIPKPEESLVRASEVAKETNVPFEAITGGFSWAKRFKRVRNEQPSKGDLTTELWKKIQILNMQREGAKSDPSAFNADGTLSEGFRQHWDMQHQLLTRPMVEKIRAAPSDRVGAAYAVLDSSGQKPIFTIERVDWNKKSPNQWKVTSATNPNSKATYFRSLTEAERSLKGVLNADPAMTASQVFTHGLSLASSDNRHLRMFGRSLMSIGALRLGKKDLAESLKPISRDDAVTLMSKELGVNIGQALINARGRFHYASNNTTLADMKDAETFFHETGHFITKEVYKHRLGREDVDSISDADLRRLFTEEEMVILDGMGKKEYTQPGNIDPSPIEAESYAREGISGYYRTKLYGLEPESNLTALFSSSEAGKRLQAKLDSFLNGIDPENPNNMTRIPGLGDKLSRVAQIWDRYRQQNDAEITEAMTSGTRGGIITHPVRSLGRMIQQGWFSKTEPSEIMQTDIWKKSGFQQIPDERNLRFLHQFFSGSSAGQMGRGGLQAGKLVTPTGTIDFKPLPEAIAEAGFTSVRGKNAQVRLLNEYVTAHRLAETKRQIMLYDESRQAHIDFGKGKKAAQEAAITGKKADVPQDPTGNESKTIPGRKLMSWGEILGVEKEIEELRAKTPDIETLGRKYVQGVRTYDPIEHLRKLDEAYPNAYKIMEWEHEFDAARELAHSPTSAGGSGTPSLAENGDYLYGDHGERVIGESDLHGLDLNEIRRRLALNRKNFRSTADRIRQNPYLDSNLNLTEVSQYQTVGGKTLRATDYWGTGKHIAPHTEWTMKLENTVADTTFNRVMHEYYEMIKMQNKAGLNIGSIPDSSAVQSRIKEGKLPDLEREMMVGYRFNGHNVYIQFNPNTPEGLQAFNAVKRSSPLFAGHEALDIIFSGPKRMMVLGTTGANVGFLLYTNAFRDSATSAIQTKITPELVKEVKTKTGEVIKSRGGFGGFGRTFHDFLPFLIRANIDLVKVGPTRALELAKKRGPEEGSRFESFLRYQASPVKGSALVAQDYRNRSSQDSDLFMRAKMIASENEGNVSRKLANRQLRMHTVSHPIDALRTFLTISEDLNRFPEFYLTERAMKAQGLNPTMQPILNGAEVSVDFKRSGMYGQVLNDFIPFFNPSLQGLNKFGRVLFNDQKPSLKNINKHALALAAQTVTIPSLGLWAINRDEEWFKELPNWEKLLFWHFKVKDTVVRLPVPFEWGLIMGQLPIMVYDSIYNDAPERVKQQMVLALKQLVPYGFIDNLPQTIKPVVEAGMNKNVFTGIPIETKRMQGMLPTERYTSSTLDVYKGTANLMSILHAPEMLQSPVMIEHLTRGYFGSVMNQLFHDIEGAVKLDPSVLKYGSLTSRMFSKTDRPGQSVQDFYEKLDVADKAWKTAKNRIENGDKAAAAKILNKYKNQIGLSAKDIRSIIISGNTETPPLLRSMHQKRLELSDIRKNEDYETMTEIAQAIMGRDWE